MSRFVIWTVVLAAVGLTPGCFPITLVAQTGQAPDVQAMLRTMLANEQNASAHRGFYSYMSEERSDRTGQHLWVEKVVETPVGRVRLLEAEDGQPVSQDRHASEVARLQDDAAHPDAFAKREAGGASDEAHAKQMLQLLPRAFLFDAPVNEGEFIRLHYRPSPDFQPSSIEERVLRSMHGSVLIDRQLVRLREVDGRLDSDVSLGFGPLAVVKAGSNFDTLREHLDGQDWKTERTHTDIMGRAFMLKNLGRKGDLKRWNYAQVPSGLSVADAVKLVLR